MFKYLFFLLFSLSAFSQEVGIPTQFSVDGSLYKNLNKNLNELSQPIVDFEETEVCFVIDYLGRDNYKVKYKEWIGIVVLDDLEVNEDIMDLYYAYQDRQRTKAIEVKEDRQRKIEEIANEEERKQQAIRAQFVKDSMAKVILRQKAIRAEFVKDSTAKAIDKQRAIKAQFVKDSIAQVIEHKRYAREQFVKDSITQVALEQKVIRDFFVKDSIAKVFANKKIERDRFLKDSIAKAISRQNATREEFVKDSMAKVIAQQKAIRVQFEKDSMAKAIAERNAIRAQFEKDSLAIIKLRQKAIRAEFVKDSLTKAIAKQNTVRTQFVKDSVPKNISEENSTINLPNDQAKTVPLEFRNTCHYAINEFDPFYNIKTIRTEPYKVAEDLTLELYKQGGKTNIFINSKANLGCVSYFSNNRSSIKVTLENNQVISFYHSWDLECGEFLFKGNLSQSQMNILSKSPIKSIRLRGTKGSKEIKEIKYKTFFLDKLKCIE